MLLLIENKILEKNLVEVDFFLFKKIIGFLFDEKVLI